MGIWHPAVVSAILANPSQVCYLPYTCGGVHRHPAFQGHCDSIVQPVRVVLPTAATAFLFLLEAVLCRAVAQDQPAWLHLSSMILMKAQMHLGLTLVLMERGSLWKAIPRSWILLWNQA